MSEKPESARARATRRHLDETLLALLHEEPISHVTVTELCRRAHVNRSTYYVYFDNPLAQLDELEAAAIDGLVAQVDHMEMQNGFSRERLQAIVEETISYIAGHEDVFRVLWSPHGSATFERRLLTALGMRALTAGERTTPEAQQHLLQCVYSLAGTFALVRYWLAEGGDLDPGALVQTIVRTNADAIAGMANGGA